MSYDDIDFDPDLDEMFGYADVIAPNLLPTGVPAAPLRKLTADEQWAALPEDFKKACAAKGLTAKTLRLLAREAIQKDKEEGLL